MPDCTAGAPALVGLGAVVEEHAALAVVALADDDALAAVVHGEVVATIQGVGGLLGDHLGEEIVAGAGPDTGMAVERTHPVAITRVGATDLAIGVRPR